MVFQNIYFSQKKKNAVQMITKENILFSLKGSPTRIRTRSYLSLSRIENQGYVVLFLSICEGRFRRDVVLVGFAEGFRSLHFFRE